MKYYGLKLGWMKGLITLLASVAFAQPIRFRDATRTYNVRGNVINGASCYGHGAIMADLNHDDRPDIYISNAVRDAYKLAETLYISVPAGYQENDKARRVEDSYGWTGSHGIIFFDYNNDGYYDIYNATTDDRNRLYRNDGNGYFEDVTDAVGLPKFQVFMPDFDPAQSYGYGTRGVVAFDANSDGWLDLYGVNWGPAEKRYADSTGIHPPIKVPPQPNEFYLNQGNGTYKKIDNSGATPLNPTNMGSQGVTALDIDEDGDVDVFVCHRNYVSLTPDGRYIGGPDFSVPVYNQLFINDGSGHFSERAAQAGLTTHPYNDCNGATFADYDNDGDYDAFIVPKDKKRGFMRVYRNDGRGSFSDITEETKLSAFGFSCFLFDVDNDGDLDFLNPRTRDATLFYRNDNGVFRRDDATGITKISWDPRGGCIGDVDNDGDLDVYYTDANKDQLIIMEPSFPDTIGNHLFINETQTTNGWLKITGRGAKGDAGGFGSKIWVFDQGYMDDLSHLVGYRQVINAYGYLCQDDPVQHFGLGQRQAVDVKIRLLDNTILKLYNVSKNRRLWFGKPAQMAKVGGDLQKGPAGMRLPQPLCVKVFDAYQKPLFGAAVRFTALTAGGQISELQPVYSDSNGLAAVYYIPAAAGAQQTVRATLVDASDKITEFTCYLSGGVAHQLRAISGDNQSGPVGEVLEQEPTVEVIDQANNGVPSVPLVFKVMAGGGKINGADSTIIPTNQQGQASAAWQLGSVYGTEQKLRVLLQSDRSKYVDFTAQTWGGPHTLRWLGPLTYNGQVGRALADSLTAQIVDAEGHGVKNEYVRFAIVAGDGTVNGATSIQVATNRQGWAKAQWILGKKAGQFNNQLRVEASTPYGSPTIIRASAVAGEAAFLRKVSGDGQRVAIHQPLPEALVVAVTDSFANPVSGQPLTSKIKWPKGQIYEGHSAVTDGEGLAPFTLAAGADTGRYECIVHCDTLAPAVFIFYATKSNHFDIQIIGGQQQSGRACHPLAQPLEVLVTDERGQAASGVSVQFIVQAGGGSVTPSTTVTDSLGRAVAYWTLGQSGEQIVKAALREMEEQSVIFTATLRPNQAPMISAVADTTVYELQLLQIPIRVDDADGDSVSVRLENLPSGAEYDPLQGCFRWIPGPKQAGNYQVRVVADDGQAENHLSTFTITLRVIHINHAPLLLQAIPADSIVRLYYYRPNTFTVQVRDLDGDSLRYVWTVNGYFISKDSVISLLPTPAIHFPAQLKVRVSDAESTIEHIWILDILSAVVDAEGAQLCTSLLPNHPNPFNAVTHIRFIIPQRDVVSLRIYNTNGQLINILAHGTFSAGEYSLSWQGTDENGNAVPSGLYYCVMECRSFRQVKKLLLLK